MRKLRLKRIRRLNDLELYYLRNGLSKSKKFYKLQWILDKYGYYDIKYCFGYSRSGYINARTNNTYLPLYFKYLPNIYR